MPAVAEPRQRFRRITTAGIFFQGGAAATDTSTIVAALVHGLTGSTMAVGAAAAISRYGWLFPQLIVGWLAQRQTRRLAYYKLGAFGSTLCLAGVALLVAFAGDAPGPLTITAFFLLWTAYAFVGGIVAVPYNDIVARSIASKQRSRMLRFASSVVACWQSAWPSLPAGCWRHSRFRQVTPRSSGSAPSCS
jgi:hypothetical protein